MFAFVQVAINHVNYFFCISFDTFLYKEFLNSPKGKVPYFLGVNMH